MHLGAVQNTADVVAMLETLKGEINRANEKGMLGGKAATKAVDHVTKAAQQAQKTNPDKKTVLDHLTMAQKLIEEVTAASGLVTAITGTIMEAFFILLTLGIGSLLTFDYTRWEKKQIAAYYRRQNEPTRKTSP